MEAKPEEVVLNRFGMDDEEDESYDVDNKEELNNLLVPSLAASDEFLPVEELEEEESAGPWGLWGFYSYSFASEVFSIVSGSLFLPITLEQLARDNGYTLPDHQTACSGSLNSTNQALSANTPGTACEVKWLGGWMDTASFPLYVFSISVSLQALVVASLGDAADHPVMRKSLLMFFAALGSLAATLFFFIDSSSATWSLSAILAIVANVALGAGGVCLNSFIPSLAKTTPKVLAAKRDMTQGRSSTSGQQDDEHYNTLISTATADISSNGVALGCTSGIIALCLSLILVISYHGNTDSLRWTIGFTGVWWAVFSIPVILLPPRSTSSGSSSVPTLNSFNPVKSLARYFAMFRQYKQLKNTIRFLMAWFLLSDAFSTLISTTALFAKTRLEIPPSHIIIIGLIVPTTGILGVLLAPRIQKRMVYCNGLNGSLNMLKLLIAASCLTPGYVTVALIFGVPVLTTEAEMFILAAVFGLFYGAFQSYARSVYAELIPPGQEAKWYALYSITDKSSSFFGPLVVGVIADSTHNIRFGYVFILGILLLSIPILSYVDVPSGKLKADEFSKHQL